MNKNVKVACLILGTGFFIFLAIFLVLLTMPQIVVPKINKINVPTFSQYAVELGDSYDGKIAEVDLDSHPKARMFKTALREGVKNGPNFAFYYTIVEWGCGTECHSFAVVDVRDGKVYFPNFGARWGYGFEENSSLLVVNPVEVIYETGGQDLDESTEYYVLENNQFTLIKKAKIRYTEE